MVKHTAQFIPGATRISGRRLQARTIIMRDIVWTLSSIVPPLEATFYLFLLQKVVISTPRFVPSGMSFLGLKVRVFPLENNR